MLVRVDGKGMCFTHPIAGTRRRGADDKEDDELAAELLADEKERAEHIMLVDLGRNDLGRVASPGSVHVDSLMHVERYSHVMHIVTNREHGCRMDSSGALQATRSCPSLCLQYPLAWRLVAPALMPSDRCSQPARLAGRPRCVQLSATPSHTLVFYSLATHVVTP